MNRGAGMSKHTRTTQSGYSLAEILVAVAVFALIILAALLAYDRSNREFKLGVEAANLQQNTRVAFDKLSGDLRSAGFDFDRDGIPAGSVGGTNQYQQPDEQFEYIGQHAIAIRGNFDYETEATPCPASTPDNCDNGRERTYESTQFPVVTTGNDEIIAYGLVPDSQTTIPACDPATNCIQFYADTYAPRKSYPSTGGLDERVVKIPGVDLGVAQTSGTYMGQTCSAATPCYKLDNPPYTLYRFSLDRTQQDFTTGANVVRTPLATNIRSVKFTYYQDAQGFVTLKDLENDTDVSTGSPIFGEGPYTVANPTAVVRERITRAKINAIRVELIGMNEAPDRGYTVSGETVASVANRRQYRLETLISPRNIQKRGMKEQDTIAPGAPTDLEICTGRCGGVYLHWTAPAVNATQGAPDQYQIVYDLRSEPGFRYRSTTYSNTFGYVFPEPGDPSMIPNVEYKFAVVALNSFGSGTSLPVYGYPRNNTKPEAPTALTATPRSGIITLQWQRPLNDASGTMACTSGTPPSTIPSLEIQGYRIERTTDPSGTWDVIADETVVQSAATTVTWEDTTVQNCITYHYRVTAIEECIADAAYNLGGIDQAKSDPSVEASATPPAQDEPKPPTSFKVDQSSPIVSGNANVNMSWSKVTQDMSDNPINVSSYKVYRRQIAPAAAATGFTEIHEMPMSGTSPDTLTWDDMGLPATSGEQYEYYVTALQCPGAGELESGPSNTQKYPCIFSADALNSPPLNSDAFDGSGLSDLDPWLVVDDATVTVNHNTSATDEVSSATFSIYDETGSLMRSGTDSLPPYEATWVLSGDLNRVDVSVLDENGCTTAFSRWVQNQPQACCLLPQSASTGVMSFTAGNDFVEITLKNVCQGTLDIQNIEFTWTGAIRPTRVLFPTASGTDTVNVPGSATSPTTVTPGGTVIDVPADNADSSTYKITVRFASTLAAGNPITGFTVNYIRQTESTTEACSVVP